MPSGPMLKAIRTAIFENFDEFMQIINAKSFKHHFGTELWGDKLTTAPKGFPKDFEGLNYLKYKHYTIVKGEPDKIYTKPDFMKEVNEVFKAMADFNAFLNRAVEDVERN
jgi:uncharacterized protein (TIGR02453 family)